jgi:hypothetical protein
VLGMGARCAAEGGGMTPLSLDQLRAAVALSCAALLGALALLAAAGQP